MDLRWRAVLSSCLLLALIVFALSFVGHALHRGLDGIDGAPTGYSRLFTPGAWGTNVAIFGHMISGAVITVLAPIQLMSPVRTAVPRVHRWTGYVLSACAVVTALGGIAYIVARGTIGGLLMDVAFAGYGACVLIATVQTVRLARARDFERHREWALRLFVLAIGSWIYRVHYQAWYALTGGLGVAPDFSGPFDQIQTVAFYVPYLIGLEIILRLGRRTRERPRRRATA